MQGIQIREAENLSQWEICHNKQQPFSNNRDLINTKPATQLPVGALT